MLEVRNVYIHSSIWVLICRFCALMKFRFCLPLSKVNFFSLPPRSILLKNPALVSRGGRLPCWWILPTMIFFVVILEVHNIWLFIMNSWCMELKYFLRLLSCNSFMMQLLSIHWQIIIIYWCPLCWLFLLFVSTNKTGNLSTIDFSGGPLTYLLPPSHSPHVYSTPLSTPVPLTCLSCPGV